MDRRGRKNCSCTNPTAIGSGMVAVSVFVNAIAVGAPRVPPVVDERWNVTVNGQTIRVDGDGSLRLPNIAAADVFGPTGPGSPPDFMSDEWFQVVGTATIDGVTWYAYSEPFQITGDPFDGTPEYSVLTPPVTRRPPVDIPESVAIEVLTPLQDDTLYVCGVGGPGETEINVNATYTHLDDPQDVTLAGYLHPLQAQALLESSPQAVVNILLNRRHGLRDLSPDEQVLLEHLRGHPALYRDAVGDVMKLSNDGRIPSYDELARIGGALGLAKQLGTEQGAGLVQTLYDEASNLWFRVRGGHSQQGDDATHRRNDLIRALRANALDVLGNFVDISRLSDVLRRISEEDIATQTVMFRYLEKVAPVISERRPALEDMYKSPDSPLRNNPQLLGVLEAMDKAESERRIERPSNRKKNEDNEDK